MKMFNCDNGKNVEILPTNQSLKDVCNQKANTNNGENENPFFGCDLTDIIDRYNRWVKNLPTVEPFYAVKCNPDPMVLKILAKLGTNFDCASKVEMKTVLNLGVSPKRIILANPCKQASHITYARDNGVDMMTFDNIEELHKIKRVFPSAKLVLRIVPGNFKAQCNLGIKFGCHVSEINRLLEKAKELELDVIGVSFHVGSGCHEIEAYPTAISLARNVFNKAQELGFYPYLLDIGGGFPGHDDGPISFEQFCHAINSSLKKHFPNESEIRIIAEPGRYFVTSAFTLVTNIIAKRTVSSESPNKEDGICNTPAPPKNRQPPAFMYYINDGVYGSFNCLLYDHVSECPPLLYNGRSGEPAYACSIWGPTCDGLDCITNHAMLPELDVGDWIFFEDMGAYTMAASSSFNGMPKPYGFYVISDEYMELVEDLAVQLPSEKVDKFTVKAMNKVLEKDREKVMKCNINDLFLPLEAIEF